MKNFILIRTKIFSFWYLLSVVLISISCEDINKDNSEINSSTIPTELIMPKSEEYKYVDEDLKYGYIEGKKISYKKIDNHIIVDGDILLSENIKIYDDYAASLDVKSKSHFASLDKDDIQGGAIASGSRRWTGGIIPVYFDPNISYHLKKVIVEAMKQWEKYVKIQFVKYNYYLHPNYIHIYSGDGNYSALGMAGGRQLMSITNTDVGTSLHEIGHALGMIHEHQRPDRDKYLIVNYDPYYSNSNIVKSYASYLTKFDWWSVMMYSSYINSIGQWSLLTRTNPPRPFLCSIDYYIRIGQTPRLTKYDVNIAGQIYGKK